MELADGLEIGEHAAEPAVAHVGHAAACVSLAADGLARRALGADEQHAATVGDEILADEAGRLEVEGQRLLEVDDVDPVTLAEDVGGHLRVSRSGFGVRSEHPLPASAAWTCWSSIESPCRV